MPVAAPRPIAPPTFEYDYDSSGDVLYVVWGNDPTVGGVEVGGNAIVRLTADGRPGGLTVYDVRRAFEFDPTQDIAKQVSAIAVSLLSSYSTHRQ
jgi:uncharacterized protein DUF2283